MTQQLLTIVAPPSAEDTLVDWLLQKERVEGFSSVPVRFHGAGHAGYSVAEQVSGRQAQTMYQVQATKEVLDELVADLHRRFEGAEIRYWRVPLLGYGSCIP